MGMLDMPVFDSWSDVYLTILVTSLEVAIFLFIYKIWKVVGILRYHPAFAGFVKEAKNVKTNHPAKSVGIHGLDDLLKEEDIDAEEDER